MREVLLLVLAFAYFDMISWLESKIRRKSIQEIIRGKYLGGKRRKTKKTVN